MADVSIPLARPWMGEREADAVARVIDSGSIVQRPAVAAFERECAEVVRLPHACAVSSSASPFHLALRGIGVGPDDEAVTSDVAREPVMASLDEALKATWREPRR